MKKKSKTLKRKRLPALNPLELEGFKAKMDGQNAAANPNAETPQTVIATLDPAERMPVLIAQQSYEQMLGSIGARGRNALMMDVSLDDEIANQVDE
jgi:hypothetical protein